MNMYNQGTLAGSFKKDLIGGFTLEKETEGKTERVNFDKARMAAYEEFLKEEATQEEYRAAAPENLTKNQNPLHQCPKCIGSRGSLR